MVSTRPTAGPAVIPDGAKISRSERVVFRALGGGEGGVLLHLDTAAYHGVDETGAFIWTQLDAIPMKQLMNRLTTAFDEVPDTFRDEIDEFLSALADRELIHLEQSDALGS